MSGAKKAAVVKSSVRPQAGVILIRKYVMRAVRKA